MPQPHPQPEPNLPVPFAPFHLPPSPPPAPPFLRLPAPTDSHRHTLAHAAPIGLTKVRGVLEIMLLHPPGSPSLLQASTHTHRRMHVHMHMHRRMRVSCSPSLLPRLHGVTTY